MRFRTILGAIALPALLASTAFAQAPSTTALSTAPADRYTPCGQSLAASAHGMNNVFEMSVCTADDAANRSAPYSSTFYNWQGVVLPLDALGTSSVGNAYSMSMFVDPSFASLADGVFSSGIWLRTDGVNDDAEANADYSIIELTNENGSLHFATWDDQLGAWDPVAAVTPVLNSWATFTFNVTATGAVEDFVNGNLAYTSVAGGTRASDFYVEDHNLGTPYTADFANTTAAPEPASLVLMATGLVGLGGFVRRKRAS